MRRLCSRAALLRYLLLACAALLWARRASALDPSLDISQYAHTVWKVRDGFTKGAIYAIAQTPDGYLWLGTEFGLFRFDGVRTVPWQPPPDQHLPTGRILGLLTSHDGTLWIGTDKGLASWKNGKLTQYPELAGQGVLALFEDREGTVWVGGFGFPTGRLCAIQNGSVLCRGEDGVIGHGVVGLYEDSKGNLWAGVENGLWRWKPGPSNFYPMSGNIDSIRAFAEDDNGTLLISTSTGVKRFVNGKVAPYSLPPTVQQSQAEKLLHDRDGGLWIGTHGQGLVHVHQGRTDVFTQSDSLSGNEAYGLFEDREGNIWVATSNGLDRFRNFAVATLSANQGLPNGRVTSVLADKDGSVWLGSPGGLSRWNNGRITIFGKRGAEAKTTSNKPNGKLNEDSPSSLFQDSHGRIWVSTVHGFGYVENEQFITVNSVPGGNVHSIAEDNAGNLWIANQQAGLIRLSPRGEVLQIPWAGLGHKDPRAGALAADPFRGGLWIGFYGGDVAYFADGGIRESYSGLGEGYVHGLQVDRSGALWAATDGGLSRLKNSRIATLNSKNGLPCDAVHSVIEDDIGSFWLMMSCGLVRIARSELDAWAAAVDRNKDAGGKDTVKISATVFDGSDGVRAQAYASGYSPKVTKSSDGRLWFVGLDGVSVIDPRHLPLNKLPPLVHVEQITADGKTYNASNGLPLPARVRDLTIDYTALSLVAPEKIHFRYKLEGQDPDWREVVNDRRAVYSNLAPRHYTFRVMACNNSGVWNEERASLDFSIAPAYYQTKWFQALCVGAFLALLWALYRFRLHQAQQRFNAGLETRVNERTRIARELHDTLLQSFQGLLMRFQAVSNELAEGESKEELDEAIDQAARAITEGRNAVQGLRSSAEESNDLAAAIVTLGKELAAANGRSPEFTVRVEGAPRELHPILRDEVYRVAGEALRNTFHHADAQRIEVEIRYDERQFRLRVRDDGKGIDPKVLHGGRAGHFGLRGMRERAELVGGKLTVWSSDPRADGGLESGTEVELSIPAARAYAAFRGLRRRSWLAEKFSNKDHEMKS